MFIEVNIVCCVRSNDIYFKQMKRAICFYELHIEKGISSAVWRFSRRVVFSMKNVRVQKIENEIKEKH